MCVHVCARPRMCMSVCRQQKPSWGRFGDIKRCNTEYTPRYIYIYVYMMGVSAYVCACVCMYMCVHVHVKYQCVCMSVYMLCVYICVRMCQEPLARVI